MQNAILGLVHFDIFVAKDQSAVRWYLITTICEKKGQSSSGW